MFLEHRELLGIKGPVPEEDYEIDFGQAAVVREGSDVTVVALALMVHHTLKACDRAGKGRHLRGIDRSRAPWRPWTSTQSAESVAQDGSAADRGRSFGPCGIGAEIAAQMADHGFDDLDAPIRRFNGASHPTPYSPTLEAAVVPNAGRRLPRRSASLSPNE